MVRRLGSGMKIRMASRKIRTSKPLQGQPAQTQPQPAPFEPPVSPPRLQSGPREPRLRAFRCSWERWQSALPPGRQPAMHGPRGWAARQSQLASPYRSPCPSGARRGAGLLPASMKVQAQMQDCPMCSKLQCPFKTGREPVELVRAPVGVHARGGLCRPSADAAFKLRREPSRKINTRPEPTSRRPCKQQSDFFCCQSNEAGVPSKAAGFCYAEPYTNLASGCDLVP